MKKATLSEVSTQVLKLAKQAGVESAEVAVSSEKGFNVRVRQGKLETIEHHLSQSLSITVFHDHRSGSVSISDLSEKAVKTAVEKAAVIAKYTEPDPFSGLAEKSELAFDYPSLDLYHPWEVTPEHATDIAIQCDNHARSIDKRIIGTEATDVHTYETEYCYANSNDFLGGYKRTSHGLSCEVIAKDKDDLQRDYDYTSSRKKEMLLSAEQVAENAVQYALSRLGSQPLSTRNCPVIFTPRVAKSFWRHFLGAISGGSLYRKNSFLYEKLGESVFPEALQIYQDPHLLAAAGSRPFDAEGVRTRKIHYIENGVLKSYALGSYSARKLNMKTTGNSGGFYNVFVSHGSDDFQALLKKMRTGLVVTELIGQGVNILTGNYSRGACGFWVENGVIQYPVQEITIAGNLKEMFKNMLAVGSDVDHRGNIHTGSVLVSDMTVAG